VVIYIDTLTKINEKSGHLLNCQKVSEICHIRILRQ